jgi:hypothetical protein
MEFHKPVYVPANPDERLPELNEIAVRVYFKVNGDSTSAKHYSDAMFAAGINLKTTLHWTRNSKSAKDVAQTFQKEPEEMVEENYATLGRASNCYLRYPKSSARANIQWTLTCTAVLLYDGSEKLNMSGKNIVSSATKDFKNAWEELKPSDALKKKMTCKQTFDISGNDWVYPTAKARPRVNQPRRKVIRSTTKEGTGPGGIDVSQMEGNLAPSLQLTRMSAVGTSRQGCAALSRMRRQLNVRQIPNDRNESIETAHFSPGKHL